VRRTNKVNSVDTPSQSSYIKKIDGQPNRYQYIEVHTYAYNWTAAVIQGKKFITNHLNALTNC